MPEGFSRPEPTNDDTQRDARRHPPSNVGSGANNFNELNARSWGEGDRARQIDGV